MPSRTVTVGSAVGLHARPAALIAQAAAAMDVPVTIGKPDGMPVDAGSALMIMTLDAKAGSEVVVDGADQSAVDAIAALVARDLDA